jgi:hypothetical protein
MADWEVPRTAGKLKNDKKVWILPWKEDKKPTAEITKILVLHRASIGRLWAKLKGLPKFVVPKHKMGSGRPKKMTMVLKKMLKRHAVKFLQMTAANLQNSVPELFSFRVNHPADPLERPERCHPAFLPRSLFSPSR